MTITLDIPEEIEADLVADAQASGVPLSDYVREFILERYLEDVDDQRVAEDRLNDPRTPISNVSVQESTDAAS